MLDRNLVAALLAWCLAVLAGCGQAEVEPASGVESGSAVSAYPPSYYGQASLEERILMADVVARVRMVSVEGGVVDSDYGSPPWKRAAMRFRFRVLEYLKGSGGGEIVGVVPDADEYYEHPTEAKARTRAQELLSGRDTRWDDREAIVFLVSKAWGYWLGYVNYAGDDGYTVASRWFKNWLPEAAAASGAAGQSGDKRFLLDDPPSAGASGARGASGATTPTITLSAFKTRVAELQREIAAGDGSEEYLACVRSKYAIDRRWRWRIDSGQVIRGFSVHIDSGLAAGSITDITPFSVPVGSGHWLGGADKDLFTVVTTTPEGYPNRVLHRVLTARPLPAGRYTIGFHVIEPGSLICGGGPEIVKTARDDYVHVAAPPRTLHEAFFDPVGVGNAVGADGTNGVLKPNDFSLDGRTTTISSLRWESGTATMVLNPAASLAGYAVDFIALDGSVTSTLAFDAATQSGGTLTWSVTDQPWSDGDLLMLRIRVAAPQPAIAISGLDASIEAGQSDAFTVSASNMATTTSYSIRVTTDNSDIGFDGTCADRQEDAAVPAASTSHSAAFTLRACSATGGTVTATLLEGTTAVATATQDITVTAPPPPPPHAPAPTGLSVATTTQTTIRVSWDTVQDAHRYRLERSADGSSGWSNVDDGISGTSHTLSGLSCATTVHLRVSARGDGSPYSTTFGSPSTSVSGTTGDCPPTPVATPTPTPTAPSPPVFASSTYSFTVAENASAFDAVGQVSAVDPDGGVVTYSIVSGNAAGKFNITHNDGLIVVRGALDHDTTSSYTLTVRATDSSGATSTAVVNITVTEAP